MKFIVKLKKLIKKKKEIIIQFLMIKYLNKMYNLI